ncbi:MAG: hypothetical protein ABSF61_08115 [Anaerolineales bacterium]|jgi:hypothetical protein
MPVLEQRRGEYTLNTDQARLDLGLIREYLSTSSLVDPRPLS